jgi:hypothetical protein
VTPYPTPNVSVVTGCASSLIALRKAAAATDAHVEVEDVVSYAARALARA